MYYLKPLWYILCISTDTSVSHQLLNRGGCVPVFTDLHLLFRLCGRKVAGSQLVSKLDWDSTSERWTQLWGFHVCLAEPAPQTSGLTVKFSSPATVWKWSVRNGIMPSRLTRDKGHKWFKSPRSFPVQTWRFQWFESIIVLLSVYL